MARPPLLAILRRETRSEHTALERSAPMVTLLSGGVSINDYGRVLSAMYSVYGPLEKGLLSALKTLEQEYGSLPYDYLPRTPLIGRDLASIGVVVARSTSEPHPVSLTAEQAIGVLYVLEGATRGGRIIAPHIRQTLGLDAGSGLDLFSLHRHHEGWEGYCQWLGNVALSSPTASVEAARMVFGRLSQALGNAEQ